MLPRPVFDFADGGAEDERTLRRNEQAFDDVALLPRPLNGAAARDLSVTLFGSTLSMPLGVAPTGLAGLFWPDGECAAARAATAAGTFYCASHGSACTLEDIAATGSAPRWMQVFIYSDRGFTREMAERAKAARYDALVLTIDNQMLGNRERDIRNGFTIPPRFGVGGTLAAATKAAWLLRMRSTLPRLTFGNYVKPGETAEIGAIAGRMASLLDPGLSWADVDWLRGLVDRAAAAEGRAASRRSGRSGGTRHRRHHRVQPWRAAARRRRRVVRRAAGCRRRRRWPHPGAGRRRHPARRRRGQGAGALGAACCLIGRPQLWGLAVAGEAGVLHVLELYRREIDRVMGLMGASSVSDLGRHCLSRRSGVGQ